ncbi:hypothetical protein GCM10022420_070850 [Streptomyces iranensis]
MRLGQGVEAAVGDRFKADSAEEVVGDVVIVGEGGHDAVLRVAADGDVRGFRHKRTSRVGAVGATRICVKAGFGGAGDFR